MKKLNLFFTVVFLVTLVWIEPLASQVSQQWAARYNGPGGTDDGSNVAIDKSFNSYVLGQTGTASSSDLVLIKFNIYCDTVWVKKIDGPGESEDLPASIKLDTLGNVYIAGNSIGFGTGYDILLAKFDPLGNQQWFTTYHGGNGDDKVSGIEVNASGEVYLVGESLGAGTGLDCITSKYSSGGFRQWTVRKNGTANNTDLGVAIQLEPGTDNIYIAATIIDTGTNANYLTIKYNSSGVEQWSRTHNVSGTDNDNAQSIGVDQTGNVYVTGRTFNSATSFDYATIKYNSAGNFGWMSRYGGEVSNGADIPRELEIDSQGNIWVTGYSTGNGTGFDYTTIKYNPSGAQQFVSRYKGLSASGHDYAYSMELDPQGNAYVTGQSVGIGTGNDYATIKYNSSGDSVWVRRYNGTGNGSDIARSITLDDSLNVYVTGQSFGTTNNDITTIKYSQASFQLISKSYFQAFYNSSLNNMRRDTVGVHLKNNLSPYNTIDFDKAYLSTSGTGTFTFSNASNGTNYFLAVNHRNSIETWSSNAVAFTSGSLNYDFTTSSAQAYGNNQIQIDASPVSYGIYSGDVNQDGTIDASDLAIIDNDAYNFVSGYVASDVNGDEIVDGSDAAVTDNNASNFVSKITP